MKNIKNDIKTGNFKKVYLLYGTEDYLKKLYAGKILKALFPDDEEDMNIARFNRENFDASEFMGICDTMPFLAEKRLVMVDRVGLFKASSKKSVDETEEGENAEAAEETPSETATGSGRDALTAYIKEMPEDTVVVFVEDTADKRSKLYKAVKDNGYVCEMNGLEPGDLRMWIGTRFKSAGKNISAATADYLVSVVGTEMEMLEREILKVIFYTGEREAVVNSDIDAICTKQINAVIFTLMDELAMGNKKGAMKVYEDLVALHEPPQKIYVMLMKHFTQLLITKEMKAKGTSQNEMVTILGAHPYAVQKLMNQSGKFKTSTLRGLLEFGVQLNTDARCGKMSDDYLVEMLIMHSAS